MKRPENLDDLIAGHRDGLALPREFYTNREIHDYDIAEYWNRNWIWVGHESQIPRPGDYFLFDYGPESIIVVRDQQGEVRAHLNVCRHRGSRVCTEQAGNARIFVCPYHAWTSNCRAICARAAPWGRTSTPPTGASSRRRCACSRA